MRRAASLLTFAIAAVLPCWAHAQPPTSQVSEYSPYEKETIRRALEQSKLTVDPAPEGKIIEKIDIVRLEILEDRDPIPEHVVGIPTRRFLNSLHHLSQDFVIHRELLLGEGDRYVQVLLDETARNMRARMPLQVSLVLIVPVKGSSPDKVSLLVITKDIWSLRLSYELSVTPGGVENFVLAPQETNLFGLHHTATTRFQYQPETYTVGLGYKVPRFGTSWVGASTAANVTFNRNSGKPEGSSASIQVGQPLYSTQTEWAWSTAAGWSVGVARRYVNAHVAQFDSPETPERDGIPSEYKSRSLTASVALSRSFGWAIKNNFSLGLNATSQKYETEDLSRFNPAAADNFVLSFLPGPLAIVDGHIVPIEERRIYPSLTWSTFSNDYLRTLDIATFALQEDYRLGHEVSVSVYPVARAVGSSRDLLGASGKAAYAVAMGDGLVGASVSSVIEYALATDAVSDGSVAGSFGVVTPRFGIGRVVMNASFLNRYRNYLRARTFTGGDDRLRGYPSNFFYGKDTIFYNLEYRSTAVEILKLQLGAVAFFDAGDAAQGFDALHAKQSVGAGLRLLIPQLNRLVFRGDIAFPLKRGPFPETGISTPVDPVGFFVGFDQAFAP